MAVFKRPGSAKWQIEFEYNGVPYRFSSKTADKRLAEEIEWQKRADVVRQHRIGATVTMTLGAAIKRYWTDVVQPSMPTNLSSTALSTRSRLKRLAAHFKAGTHLQQITATKISEWKTSMLEAGKKPGTVDRYLDLLRSMLLKAKHEWGALADVPVIGRMKLKKKNSRERFLTAEEEAALLKHADPDLADLIAVALDTGGRRGDLLQLRWQDVLFDERLVAFLFTKNDEPRSVPMTDRVRKILEMRKSLPRPFPYDPTRLVRSDSRKGSRGRARKDRQPGMRSAWETARTKAGLGDVRFHDLRHTFASRLVMRGVDLYRVGILLGHKDPKTTKRYSHLEPRVLRDAIAVLNSPSGTSPDPRHRQPPRGSEPSAPAHGPETSAQPTSPARPDGTGSSSS